MLKIGFPGLKLVGIQADVDVFDIGPVACPD